MQNQYRDFTQNLKEKINNWMKTPIGQKSKWAQYIRYTPELFHVIIKLSADKDLPATEKAKIAAVVSYFVSPLDLIPEEFWGALGYVDDIALAAYVLKHIQKSAGPEFVKKYWQPERDIQVFIDAIIDVAEEMVGANYWKKLKELVAE